MKITNETVNHQISEFRAEQIAKCETRKQVAAVLTDAGYDAHVGGHHVAELAFGRRVAIITNSFLPDFN